jgi:hypothetical protein
MKIEFVKDLIRCRRDDLLLNLNFIFKNTRAQIYPDYEMRALECDEIKQFFTSCTHIELEIDLHKTPPLKIQSIRHMIETIHNMQAEFIHVNDRNTIQIKIKTK